MSLTIKCDTPAILPEDFYHHTYNATNHPKVMTIPSGSLVEYIGHVAGGMLHVEYNEQEFIIHPNATDELCVKGPP